MAETPSVEEVEQILEIGSYRAAARVRTVCSDAPFCSLGEITIASILDPDHPDNFETYTMLYCADECPMKQTLSRVQELAGEAVLEVIEEFGYEGFETKPV